MTPTEPTTITHMARRHHPLFDGLAGGWLGGRMSQIGTKQLGDRMGLPSYRQTRRASRRSKAYRNLDHTTQMITTVLCVIAATIVLVAVALATFH